MLFNRDSCRMAFGEVCGLAQCDVFRHGNDRKRQLSTDGKRMVSRKTCKKGGSLPQKTSCYFGKADRAPSSGRQGILTHAPEVQGQLLLPRFSRGGNTCARILRSSRPSPEIRLRPPGMNPYKIRRRLKKVEWKVFAGSCPRIRAGPLPEKPFCRELRTLFAKFADKVRPLRVCKKKISSSQLLPRRTTYHKQQQAALCTAKVAFLSRALLSSFSERPENALKRQVRHGLQF